MKLITLTLVIFLARCAHSEIEDSVQVASITDKIKNIESKFDNEVKKLESEIGNKVEEVESTIGNKMGKIGEKVKDAMKHVIPSCIFGVDSVSMVVFTHDLPEGKIIDPHESCDNINSTDRIVFLVHGFIANANTTNSYMLASQLVKNGYKVFSLDWSQGACTDGLPIIKLTGYPSAALKNTREIAQFMAKYVKELLGKGKVPLKNIKFIGHSLGAHVCGFAAKELKDDGYTIPRLFAADPAGPLFYGFACKNRLCKTDADRVIALHTTKVLGYPEAIGHVDFYMHYGMLQPGCSVNIVCSHSRAVEYLADMLIDNCGFVSVPMTKPHKYPTPDTTNCVLATKKLYESDNIKDGVYYTFVEPDSPYCTKESFSCGQ